MKDAYYNITYKPLPASKAMTLMITNVLMLKLRKKILIRKQERLMLS